MKLGDWFDQVDELDALIAENLSLNAITQAEADAHRATLRELNKQIVEGLAAYARERKEQYEGDK